MILGNPQATTCVYLPHQPQLPADWHWPQPYALSALLNTNSNHWRKIWVISAKIVAEQHDWRSLMEHELLKRCCFYCDEHTLNPHATIHLFSGKAISQRFFPDDSRLVKLAARSIYQQPQHHWHLPYFDYRQFPNVLINELRGLLAQ